MVSAGLFALLILSAGYTVYSIMRPQLEEMAVSGLEVALNNKIRLIDAYIADSLANTHALTTRTYLAQSMERYLSEKTRDEGYEGIAKTAEKILTTHFSAIRIYGRDGLLILSAGHHANDDASKIMLDTPSEVDTFLLWDDQFILRNTIQLQSESGAFLARITTEEPVAGLTEIYRDANFVGKSGEFMLCTSDADASLEAQCFLQDGTKGVRFKQIQRIPNNQPLPMHYALQGQKGIKFTKDYRGIDVVAAHAPASYGLGTVLKLDEAELSQQFISEIHKIGLSLLLYVLIAMAILYWLTLPYLRRMNKSIDFSLKTHKHLVQAKQDAEKTSTELSAYINAIGKLALISITDRKGKIIHANEIFCKVSGYSELELIGKDHRILNSQVHPKSFWVNLWATITKGNIWHQEICNRSKTGELYWVDSTIVPLTGADGKIERYLSVRIDITARKQRDSEMLERLKESVCRYQIRGVLEQNSDVVMISKALLEALTAALQYPEYAAGQIKLMDFTFATENYQENLTNGIRVGIEANNRHYGQLQVAYTKNLPFIMPHEYDLVENIAHDIGRWYERKETEQRIVTMATHDALTGLPNRHLLRDRIEQALAREVRHHQSTAVLFIDLDRFKIINDSLGHDIGDLLLKAVAERLKLCIRGEDTVARQGGDEFIIVLESIANPLDAGSVAQKILDQLTLSFQIHNHSLHIGASIGIALFPQDGETAEALLKNSDVAMYHAKENGRNNYQFFTTELNQSAHERHTLGLDLHHAIERNELVLHYQPVMDMPNHSLHSIEVLLRWQHPQKKLISPDKFIALAEESGLIIPIGEWVLRTVCQQIKLWQTMGYEIPRIAINLSVRQFRDKNLITNMINTLAEMGVAASYISLELTESMLIDNVDKVVNILD